MTKKNNIKGTNTPKVRGKADKLVTVETHSTPHTPNSIKMEDRDLATVRDLEQVLSRVNQEVCDSSERWHNATNNLKEIKQTRVQFFQNLTAKYGIPENCDWTINLAEGSIQMSPTVSE